MATRASQSQEDPIENVWRPLEQGLPSGDSPVILTDREGTDWGGEAGTDLPDPAADFTSCIVSATYVSTLGFACTASPKTGAQYSQVNDSDHEGLGNPDLHVDSATHNHTLSKLDHRRTLEMEGQCSRNDQRKELELMNRPIYLPGRPGKCAGRTIGVNTVLNTDRRRSVIRSHSLNSLTPLQIHGQSTSISGFTLLE